MSMSLSSRELRASLLIAVSIVLIAFGVLAATPATKADPFQPTPVPAVCTGCTFACGGQINGTNCHTPGLRNCDLGCHCLLNACTP